MARGCGPPGATCRLQWAVSQAARKRRLPRSGQVDFPAVIRLHRHGGRRPAIHDFKRLTLRKSWMVGTRPTTTMEGGAPMEDPSTRSAASRVFTQPDKD